MKITALQFFYGLLAIVGLFATWYFNIQPRENGFIADLYATSAAASITNDLVVVVLAFLVWSFVETKRLNMSYWLWSTCCILTFLIAAATMFPLFLLARERRLLAIEELASA